MSSNIKIIRICEFCRKEFTARTTVTRCCSDHCSKRRWKQEQKEKKIEQSNVETQLIRVLPKGDIDTREFFSVIEFSKLVGISRWTLWRAIKRNEIKAAKIGRRVIIDRKEIDKYFIITEHHGKRNS
jgi:excisionase family DNA binding protein